MNYRIKIQGKVYEIKSLTMGEARILRQHFDVRDLTEINPGDPFVMAGMAYLCFLREDPRLSHAQIMAKVDALDLSEDFAPVEDESADPTPAPKRKPKAGS